MVTVSVRAHFQQGCFTNVYGKADRSAIITANVTLNKPQEVVMYGLGRAVFHAVKYNGLVIGSSSSVTEREIHF